MPSILIVEKLGNIKPLSIKSFNEEELYKKAGFKVATDFKCYTVWNVEVSHTNYSIHLYGKTSGRANQENKYDFPPPMDNVLFFGNCLLISKNKDTVLDLTPKIWDSIYETLFGGFDDIGENDSEDIESEEDDTDIPKTKTGYAKDGFIVDDGDDDEDDYEEDEEDEPELVIPVKKTRAKKAVPKVELDLTVEENDYLDCKSELSEESYIS